MRFGDPADRQGGAQQERPHAREAHGQPVGQVHGGDRDAGRPTLKEPLAHGPVEERLGEEAADDEDSRRPGIGHRGEGSATERRWSDPLEPARWPEVRQARDGAHA